MNPNMQDILYCSSLCMFGTLASILNLIVMVTFTRFRKKIFARKNNRILFSMALADCLIGIFMISMGICIVTNSGGAMIRLAAMIPMFGSMFVSILSMALLTGDRLVAVKFPLRYNSVVTSRRLKIFIVASWVLPLALTLQQYMIFDFSYKLELKVRGVLLLVFIAGGSVFLAVSNSYLYAAVKKQWKWNKLHCPSANNGTRNHGSGSDADDFTERRPRPRRSWKVFFASVKAKKSAETEDCADDGPRPRKSWRGLFESGRVKKKELKVSKECVIIIFVFLCCWTPLTVYRVYHSLVTPPGIKVMRRLFLIMASLGSVINPYIYFFRKKQFKRYLSVRRENLYQSTSSAHQSEADKGETISMVSVRG